VINDIMIALASLVSLFASYVSQRGLERTMLYEEQRDTRMKELNDNMLTLIKKLNRLERREKRKRGLTEDES
jgi:hypothetical protein